LKKDTEKLAIDYPNYNSFVCSLIDREYEQMKGRSKKPAKNQYTYPEPGRGQLTSIQITNEHDRKLTKMAEASHRSKMGFLGWLIAVEYNKYKQKPVIKHTLKDDSE